MSAERGTRRTAPWALGALAVLAGCASPPLTEEDRVARLDEMVDEVAEIFPEVEAVPIGEAIRLADKDSIVLIDVREPEERAVSWIPGAITAVQYEADPSRYADRRAVAYCTIGYRSSDYAKRLTEAGHDVASLAGSILAWTHAGRRVVDDAGPTTRLHVYGQRWNLAPEGFETVW